MKWSHAVYTLHNGYLAVARSKSIIMFGETLSATHVPMSHTHTHSHTHTLTLTRWTLCSGKVNYSSADVHTSVLPVYRRFFAENKLRILVYSGDVDGVVAHTGT